MQADVWKKVEELFQAVQAQPLGKRAEFLENACPDDPQVRAEVQSLLDAAPGAASFLDSSPLSSALSAGTKLGHFEILGSLGAGGMGEVYRARDSRLKREVAIKVLPVSFACDPDRIARFEREARAASALNHPNIVSVYDIGRETSTYWIVSELVDGETLRRTIDHGPLPVRKVIEIAVQIAEGLAAAHAAGIVHRDLKPGNIMLARDGRAKILDFGLAKREQRLATDSSAPELTNKGTVLGTAGYMSPEQVRGEDVDYRSDIFSFGLILYEMLAAKQAFSGSSSIEVMNAILKDDPPELPPSVPPSLERIVRRCLEKEPARRFQSSADLGFAVNSVSVSELGRAAARRNGVWRTWGIVAVAAAAGVLAGPVWFLLHRPPSPSAELTQKRLTFNSSENPVGNAAISPDGKYLAYSDPAGIHVKLLSTGEARLIPRPAGVPAGAFWDVDSWFADSTQLLAQASELGSQASMWTVSVLGQSPRQLREGASGFEVSPDGVRIAFSPRGSTDYVREIWVMGSQGDDPQKVLAVGEDESLARVHWSPDGQRLAYIKTQRSGVSYQYSIETCDLKGARRTVVVFVDAGCTCESALNDFCWLPDGRMVYAQWESRDSTHSSLWQIGMDNHAGTPAGKPKRITQWDGSQLAGLSASADGKRLVLRKTTYQTQVYLGELAAGGAHMKAPRRLTNDEARDEPLAWTPDSKAVLFRSDRSGTLGIFKQGISQETAEPVVTGPQDVFDFRLSSDDAWILFEESPRTPANPSPPTRLMRISTSGGVSGRVPQFVLETRDLASIFCARPPANLCVIVEQSQDRKQLMITAVDPLKGRGKVLRAVRNADYVGWGLSPDGSTVAVSRGSEPEIHIRLLSLSGGSDREIAVKGWPNITGLDWSPDGRGLYCGSASSRVATLLYVDLKGNSRVLWQYKAGGATWAIPSPDGRYLAIEGAVTNSNVWAVDGF